MKITRMPNTVPFARLSIGEVFTQTHDPDTPLMSIELCGCDECYEVNAVNLEDGRCLYISGSEEVVPHLLSFFTLK